MIIDFSVKPPRREFYEPFFGKGLAGYRDAYLDREASRLTELLAQPFDEYVDGLARDGVIAVIRGLDAETTTGVKVSNESVAALVREYPDRFIGFAGIDPHKGRRAVQDLRHAVLDLGLRGVNFQLMENNLTANDRRMYPIYEVCAELGVVVNLHASFHFLRGVSMRISHPANLDDVAIDFPELTIVAAPPGFPWVHELIAVAWRHPNVHIGLSAARPKLLAKPGSGYEGLLAYGSSILQDRIIFGSSFPLTSTATGVSEIQALPLTDEVREKWLWANAARVLGIEG